MPARQLPSLMTGCGGINANHRAMKVDTNTPKSQTPTTTDNANGGRRFAGAEFVKLEDHALDIEDGSAKVLAGALRRRCRIPSIHSEEAGTSTPASEDTQMHSSGASHKRVQISTEVETVEAVTRTPLQADRKRCFAAGPLDITINFESPTTTRTISVAESPASSAPTSGPFLLPGIATRKVRMAFPSEEEDSDHSLSSPQVGEKHGGGLMLATPSSCKSAAYRCALTPRTPDPARDGFRSIGADLDLVFFDFDGTLTATPGMNTKQHSEKGRELKERAEMLRPRLESMIEHGLLLGIMSKSTESTIRDALDYAGLTDLFKGPILGKALDFEGKAGIIAKMYEKGQITLGPGGLSRVLLIDDDVRDLDRCREFGIQTFAAPEDGGLLDCDFDEILACLNIPSPVGRGHSLSPHFLGETDED